MSSRSSQAARAFGTAACVVGLALAALSEARAAAPANDDFANAIALPAAGFKVSGTTVGASRELGEPDHATGSGTASVWYSWTPTANVTAGFSLFGSNFDTVIAVYTGTSVSALTLVASNDDTFGNTSYVMFAATAGTKYFIAVDGFGVNAGNYVLTFAPASNDNFANRTALSGTSFTVRDINNLCTKETGEPNHGGDAGGASLWYKWVAPSSGRYALSTLSNQTNFDTLLAVYTGTAVNALTLVAQNDDANGTTQSLVEFSATAGTEYEIAVDGKAGATGSFQLGLIPAPANDNFVNAAPLSGASASASGYILGASKETGEPNHGGDAGGHSVWYTWTAPASGNVFISTTGSNFDTLLGVYTGATVNALTLVAQNDDDTGVTTSLVTFAANAGTVYAIAVDGKGGVTGSFDLTLASAPANDNFAAAIALNGDSNSVSGSTIGATKETGEPNHGGNTGGHSVWYNWTPVTTGQGQIIFINTTYSVQFGVYGGTSVNALTTISSNKTTFPVRAGSTYRIAIDGDTGQSGLFVFTTQVNVPPAPPANDDFANAQPLTGLIATVSGDTEFATTELGEPLHAGVASGASVWFSYTAPQTRPMTLSTAGSKFNTVLAVYTGAVLPQLVPVAGADPIAADGKSSTLTFNATAGTTYLIALAGIGGAAGQYTLTLNPGTIGLGSGLLISSNPAVVGQGLTFSVAADAAATFSFDFGDGTATTTTDSSVTHAYSAPGTFTVTVTANLPMGATTTATSSLLVRPVFNLLVQRSSIKLNFAASAGDSITITGLIFVPDGVKVTSQPIIVNVGGVTKMFTTDATGAFKSAVDSAKFTYTPIAGGGNAKFSLVFAKQAFQSTLAPLGLVNKTIANLAVQLPIEIVFNGTSYQFTQTVFYKATAGKSGATK